MRIIRLKTLGTASHWMRTICGTGFALLGSLCLTGCFSDWGITYDGIHEGLFGELPEPSEREAVEMAFDRENADRRRMGLAWLGAKDNGGDPEYLAAYRLFAADQDPGVRAAVAKALGRHGEVQDAAVLATLLVDDDGLVRWQAADALRKIHNPDVVPALVERLDPNVEEDADTRAAVAMALGQYPDRLVFTRLLVALNQSSFQVVNASHRSLILLTGHDAGLDPRRWADWSEDTPDLFANQQTYTYGIYDPTRSYWDRYVTFWNNDDSSPQTPRGISAAEAIEQ